MNHRSIPDVPDARDRLAAILAKRDAELAAMTPEERKVIEERQEQSRKWESERKARERNELAQRFRAASGIPERFVDADFDSLDDLTPERRDAAAILAAIVVSPHVIGLIGPRGRGKTHLACAAANQFFYAGLGAKYTTAKMLFLALRDTFRPQYTDSPTEKRIIDELIHAPLLILDEAHERSGSAWEDSNLVTVLDGRYAAEKGSGAKATIIISNESPRQFLLSLGPSIASRFQETGRIIDVSKWPNQRAKKRELPARKPMPAIDEQKDN